MAGSQIVPSTENPSPSEDLPADWTGSNRRGGGRASSRWIALLIGLVLAEGAAIAWFWKRSAQPAPGFGTAADIAKRFREANPVRDAHPGIDFTRFYPGHTAEEIDYLQRECTSLRYIYAPFVEFRHLPGKGRFVEIAQGGFRVGPDQQPWPPNPGDYSVFLFGGSTTFGFGAFADQTVAVYLQQELSARLSTLHVQCYNFGANAYLLSQDRALLESLIAQGVTPRAAIFIDGLNEFSFPDGKPQLTPILYRIVTPDVPYPALAIRNEAELSTVVDNILARYERNLRITTSVAAGHGIRVAFIGQPTPFLDLPIGPDTYPFGNPRNGQPLNQVGYARFKAAAMLGRFGDRFVWCGDAFSSATSPMYADGVHYSAEGARVLAKAIAERVIGKALLP